VGWERVQAGSRWVNVLMSTPKTDMRSANARDMQHSWRDKLRMGTRPGSRVSEHWVAVFRQY